MCVTHVQREHAAVRCETHSTSLKCTGTDERRHNMKTNIPLKAGVSIGLALALAGGVGCTAKSSDNASSSTTPNTSTQTSTNKTTSAASLDLSGQKLSESDIQTSTTYSDSTDGGHALQSSGTSENYAGAAIEKTGDSSGDEADFYGENAAVFATESATLSLSDILVNTNGTHANGVFSYGSDTTVNISHSLIQTSGNCSGGLMTTGGGTTNAENVTAETTGNSSAAIRSDRGGGNVNVTGGYFTTTGTGSPVIYSTANIAVKGAYLESSASQGVVVEGKNSVSLTGCQLIASNTTKNSNKSDYYQAVMIYQSMSGDASSGTSSFSMSGSSLENENGDIFFVNNTSCTINVSSSSIVNNDTSGVFLRAAAAGWGNEGSNGGKVALTASDQVINGNMLVDDVSALNLYLQEGSNFMGAINPTGQAGDVYVEIDANSSWTLTQDSYVTSLSCVQGTINLNGHKLYVNGVEYDGESASVGSAVDVSSSTSSGGTAGGMAPSGSESGSAPGSAGEGGAAGAGSATPPEKP